MRRGLVNRIVPADGLMAWALETAEVIAANSPSAVQAVKQQISATIASTRAHARRSTRSWATGCGRALISARVSPRFGRSARLVTSDPPPLRPAVMLAYAHHEPRASAVSARCAKWSAMSASSPSPSIAPVTRID
jgi:hypothetical protein